ncbi:hypothetical protein M408DRAFT_330229 [Serendipita vermifera MAFF 305830]|uniref:Uncharacterized protein n=1 Tax=Serendipita vermifera MAFF 305830 TaxID=933852 RepID=A0A0C2XDI7_SERVB|nr:hypothetical protein M408DRAFT_330229 [Serendipita vermifera MAFF 305830]
MPEYSSNPTSQEAVVESGAIDTASEVERATKRLRDSIIGEEAARESLEALLKKRREEALEAVVKAQHHLELVDAEERKLRQMTTRSGVLHERDIAMGAPNGSHSQSTSYDHSASGHNEITHLQYYLNKRKSRLEQQQGQLSKIQERIESLKRIIQKYDNPNSTPLSEDIDAVKAELKSEEGTRDYLLSQIELNGKESGIFRRFIIAEQD